MEHLTLGWWVICPNESVYYIVDCRISIHSSSIDILFSNFELCLPIQPLCIFDFKKMWVLMNFGQYSKKVAKVCFLIEVVAAGWPTQFFDRPPFFQYIVVLNECSGKKWTKIASLLSAQWVDIEYFIFFLHLCFAFTISVLKSPYKTLIHI